MDPVAVGAVGRAVLSYKSVGAVTNEQELATCFHWQSASVDYPPRDAGRARNSTGFRIASDHYHREDSVVGA